MQHVCSVCYLLLELVLFEREFFRMESQKDKKVRGTIFGFQMILSQKVFLQVWHRVSALVGTNLTSLL